MKYLIKLIDSAIYLFIVPFSVLFVFPKFFRELDSKFYSPPFIYYMDKTGVIFMWSGALLATLCGLLMFLNKFGSVIPFIKPTKLVTSGPYALVRHPMMWALLFVLFGEVITYCSLFTFLWLTIWSRLSYIYICDYEDPYLLQCFGEEYLQYSKKVPRWIPGSKPQPII